MQDDASPGVNGQRSTYLPAAQGMQSVGSSLPVASAYLPAPQAVQLLRDELLGTVENLPAVQLVQLPLPDISENLPGAQSAQF